MHDQRELIEANLTSDELVALAAVCDIVPIPFNRWLELPALARPFVVLAAERLADRIKAERQCSLTVARRLAATRLGENGDSIERVRRLWRARAYRNVVPGHAYSTCVD